MTAYIWLLLTIHAPNYGIDPKLAAAVIKTESNFNPKAIGSVGERGLFQIRPEFSRYKASELMDPRINVMEGLRFLKAAKRYCVHKGGKLWITCYNLGIKGGSRIRYPEKWPYYRKVWKHYAVYKEKK